MTMKNIELLLVYDFVFIQKYMSINILNKSKVEIVTCDSSER